MVCVCVYVCDRFSAFPDVLFRGLYFEGCLLCTIRFRTGLTATVKAVPVAQEDASKGPK